MSLEISNSSLRDFEEALREYQRATNKDCADILNRAALNVAYRAAQFTPIAAAADIRAGLFRDPRLVYALTALSLKKRGIGKLPKGQFQVEVDKFVARRVGSARYLRGGWADAIKQLGGSFRGKLLQRGLSGYADRATVEDLVAEIAAIIDQPTDAKAESAENVSMKALEEAVNFVAADMANYAQEKLARTAEKYSG